MTDYQTLTDQSIRETKRLLRKRAEYDREIALDLAFRKHLTTTGYAYISSSIDRDKAITKARIQAIGVAEFVLRKYLPYEYTLLQKEITFATYTYSENDTDTENDTEETIVYASITAQWM